MDLTHSQLVLTSRPRSDDLRSQLILVPTAEQQETMPIYRLIERRSYEPTFEHDLYRTPLYLSERYYSRPYSGGGGGEGIIKSGVRGAGGLLGSAAYGLGSLAGRAASGVGSLLGRGVSSLAGGVKELGMSALKKGASALTSGAAGVGRGLVGAKDKQAKKTASYQIGKWIRKKVTGAKPSPEKEARKKQERELEKLKRAHEISSLKKKMEPAAPESEAERKTRELKGEVERAELENKLSALRPPPPAAPAPSPAAPAPTAAPPASQAGPAPTGQAPPSPPPPPAPASPKKKKLDPAKIIAAVKELKAAERAPGDVAVEREIHGSVKSKKKAERALKAAAEEARRKEAAKEAAKKAIVDKKEKTPPPSEPSALEKAMAADRERKRKEVSPYAAATELTKPAAEKPPEAPAEPPAAEKPIEAPTGPLALPALTKGERPTPAKPAAVPGFGAPSPPEEDPRRVTGGMIQKLQPPPKPGPSEPKSVFGKAALFKAKDLPGGPEKPSPTPPSVEAPAEPTAAPAAEPAAAPTPAVEQPAAPAPTQKGRKKGKPPAAPAATAELEGGQKPLFPGPAATGTGGGAAASPESGEKKGPGRPQTRPSVPAGQSCKTIGMSNVSGVTSGGKQPCEPTGARSHEAGGKKPKGRKKTPKSTAAEPTPGLESTEARKSRIEKELIGGGQGFDDSISYSRHLLLLQDLGRKPLRLLSRSA